MAMADQQLLNDITEIRRQINEVVETERIEYQAPDSRPDAPENCPFDSRDINDGLNRNEDGDSWLYIEMHRGFVLLRYSGGMLVQMVYSLLARRFP
jgi:hypothetical protein